MIALAVVLSVLALPLGLLLIYGLSLFGQQLGDLARPDRITRRDQRWLAAQSASNLAE